jgi:hypothetical protein
MAATAQRLASQPTRSNPCRPRRGATSLIVVMVLFFVVTLVAAYASRNLLFEQRTAANQLRATVAFETAEAGVEWALAQLNGGRVDDHCVATASTTQPTFRERYLSISGTSGTITPLMQAGAPTVERRAGCVFNGTDWVCRCPTDADPALPVPTADPPHAAFWVRFQPMTVAAGVTGVIRMQVNACTRVATPGCLDFNRQAEAGDGLATLWTVVALRGGFTTFPAAALTAGGPVTQSGGNATITNNLSGAAVASTNVDLSSSGITVRSGASIDASTMTLNTVAGSPPASSLWPGDSGLSFGTTAPSAALPAPATPANRAFSSVFGMWPGTFDAQPGLASVPCGSDCTATDVNTQILRNPGHVIRIDDGGATGRRLRIGADIGSAAAPVVIVADPGVNIEFDSGTPTVHGLVYSRAAAWALRGNGTIEGAAVAQGSFDLGPGSVTLTYSPSILLGARFLNGSFVKVPGGWRDLQP